MLWSLLLVELCQMCCHLVNRCFLIDGLEIFGLTFLEVEEKAVKVTERTRQSLNMSYCQFTHSK